MACVVFVCRQLVSHWELMVVSLTPGRFAGGSSSAVMSKTSTRDVGQLL